MSQKRTWEDEKVYAERKKMADDYFDRQKLLKEQKAAQRRKFLNDPKNKAKIELQQLRTKYGLTFFVEEAQDFKKLIDICRRIDNGSRLTEIEITWLSSGESYFTDELNGKYHKNEAEYYAIEFEKTSDPWHAVNGSSHYRKCDEPDKAESLLGRVNKSDIKNSKLQSALLTVHGGVKRDRNEYEKAINYGEQAHDLTPKDYRPCTLIGAVYMETGQFSMGRTWYEKAEARGFEPRSADSELRSIFKKANKTMQIEMSKCLLDWDPNRFRWADISKGD